MCFMVKSLVLSFFEIHHWILKALAVVLAFYILAEDGIAIREHRSATFTLT